MDCGFLSIEPGGPTLARHRHPSPIGRAQLPVGSGRRPPREPRRDLLFRTARASINVDASLSLGEADLPFLVFREGGQMERPVEFDRIDETADRVGIGVRITDHQNIDIGGGCRIFGRRTEQVPSREPTVLARPGHNRANFRRELIRRHFLLSRPIRSPNLRVTHPSTRPPSPRRPSPNRGSSF